MYVEQQELTLYIQCSFQVSFISFNLEQLVPQSFYFLSFMILTLLKSAGQFLHHP